MGDLLWDDVKDMFDPEANGTLPDVEVTETTVRDWQVVLDLPRSMGWRYEYEENGRVVRMPGRADDVLSTAQPSYLSLRVWPVPGVLAIFRPWAAGAIYFDVDLRELQGQERLDDLCSFLRLLGRRLGKAVLMYPEGHATAPDIGYLPGIDRVVNLAPLDRRHPKST